MKIKRLLIDGFKNLQKFDVKFENNDLAVLIGNNGSGKSNVLEAISELFSALYGQTVSQLSWKFIIEYEIDNNKINITKRSDLKYKINTNEVNEVDFFANPDNLPDKVFAIYSGEELRLWEKYYKQFYVDFYIDVIRNSTSIESLKMNFLNKYFWNIATLLLFMKNEEKCKKLLNGISISEIEFEIHTNNLNTFARTSPNRVTDLINAINDNLVNNKISIGDFVSLEYQGAQVTDIYIELYYKLLVASLPKEDEYKTINKITILFDNNLTTRDLSEGQKKEILVAFVADVLASNKSLLLLDEPDSHIHPINKQRLIEEIQTSDVKSTFLTTHSPTLTNILASQNIVLVQNGKAKQEAKKIDILKDITNGMWFIDSINQILVSNKDIILVEGKTDIEFIQTALEKLISEPLGKEKYGDLNLLFLPFGGGSGLVNFIEKFTPSNSQKIIALLDRDYSGRSGFCEVFHRKYDSLSEADYNTIHVKNNIYISFLPPKKKLGIKDDFEIEDYFGITKLKKIARELLSEKKPKQLKDFFHLKEEIKSQLPKKSKTFDVKAFKAFEKLFDLIIKIKSM